MMFLNNYRYTFDHLEKGQYSFRVQSISLAMTGTFTNYEFINIYDQGYSKMAIVGIVFLSLFISSLIGAAAFLHRQTRLRLRMRSLNASTQNIMVQLDEVSLGGSQEDDVPPFYHAQNNREFF